MIISYVTFLVLLAAISLCTHKIIRCALGGIKGVDLPIYTLSLVVGIPLFLLAFSVIARVVAPYQLALPLTLLTLHVLGLSTSRWCSHSRKRLGWSDRVCLSFFGVLAVAIYLLRTYWPAIHWENSVQRIGVERMFNLSLQQSFLHAKGWPVDNLWLYGEPLDYHVLLRALPGLTNWLIHAVSGATMSGGIVYLLTDALYLALAPTAVVACALVVVPLLHPYLDRAKVALSSSVLALFAFLTPNGKALRESLRFLFFGTGSNDFWLLQHAVVPGTVSYFPYGLLLSGESHSYAQAPFLSIAWLSLVIVYVAGKKNIALTVVLAALGAMITQSHPATAIVCALVSLPLFVWDTLRPVVKREPQPWRNIAYSLAIGALAVIFLLPMYFEHLPPEMKWVFVSTSVVSSIGPFFAVHLFACVCLGLAAILVATKLKARRFTRSSMWSLAVILVAAAAFYQRPIIALSLAYIGALTVCLGSMRSVPVLALAGAFLVWVFPEILVTDWVYDNRTDWIRFNTAMRLWLESTYLFPLAILLVVAPELTSLLEQPRSRIATASVCIASFACVALSLFTLTTARMDRAPERPSIDGYAFVKEEHPYDFELITYLSQLPIKVVIGEACGDGSHPLLPYHYAMPGRISAFSGRPSLCGWARHTWMFQRRLRRANVANETIWQSFLSTGESLKALYQIGGPVASDPQAVSKSLRYLQQRGMTHLVIGELERKVYPSADPQIIARGLGGQVLFNPAPGMGVVELPVERLP